jgi:quinol monooxygenase YgiN
VDDRGDTHNSLVVGVCKQLHDGWVHPYFACDRNCYSVGKSDSGEKNHIVDGGVSGMGEDNLREIPPAAECFRKGPLRHQPQSLHPSRRSAMIETIIKMTVPAEKRKEVLQTIKAILGPIRRERGCISCNCYVDVEDENVLFFEEEWRTSEDLENHLRSEHFGVLNGAMKLLRVTPAIRFNTITTTAGLEAITAARA